MFRGSVSSKDCEYIELLGPVFGTVKLTRRLASTPKVPIEPRRGGADEVTSAASKWEVLHTPGTMV